MFVLLIIIRWVHFIIQNINLLSAVFFGFAAFILLTLFYVARIINWL